jgi:hypothetical protein
MRRAAGLSLIVAALGAVAVPSPARAQAEQAPPDYVPPGAPAAEPGQPAPATPVQPGIADPGSSPAPPPPAWDAQPKWHIAIGPRMAVQLGDGPVGLPRIGYGGGVQVVRALVPLKRLRFGVGVDFAYDRIYRDKVAPESGTQFLSHASFAALGVFDGLFGRVRPWLALGGGLSVASYEDPPAFVGAKGSSELAAVGLVHVGLGLGVRIYESFELGLRGDFNFTFSDVRVGTPSRQPFQPGLFALGLDLGFRF